jgi:hypothetical protein
MRWKEQSLSGWLIGSNLSRIPPNSSNIIEYLIIGCHAAELRSWVQIPPGPFLSVMKVRHWFEFNLDNCRTKTLFEICLPLENDQKMLA